MHTRKADALAAAGDAEAAMRAGTWVDPRHAEITFGEWAATWASAQGGGAATKSQRDSFLRVHLLPVFGEMPLRAITPLTVQAWVSDLEESGYARSSIRALHKMLARVLRAAVVERLLTASPVPARMPAAGPPAGEKVFLTLDEVLRLGEEVPRRYRALVLLGAGGGLRWGEMVGLQAHRLDMLRRRVTVAAVLEEIDGVKSHRQYGKSSASMRTVSLPRWVTEPLAEHLAEYPPTRVTDDTGKSVPAVVFTTDRGALLSRNNFRSRVWLPAVAAAGAPVGVTVHGLRHTHAALCIADGVSPKALQVRLGHKSITTTLDTYGHLLEDADEEVADGLDARHARAADGQQMGSRSRATKGSGGTRRARAKASDLRKLRIVPGD